MLTTDEADAIAAEFRKCIDATKLRDTYRALLSGKQMDKATRDRLADVYGKCLTLCRDAAKAERDAAGQTTGGAP